MVSKKFTLANAQGFHMRPASVFSTAMGKYACEITIKFNGNDYNGKSLLNIIAACIKCGSEMRQRVKVRKTLPPRKYICYRGINLWKRKN